MEYFELGNLDSMRDWGHAKVSPKFILLSSKIKNSLPTGKLSTQTQTIWLYCTDNIYVLNNSDVIYNIYIIYIPVNSLNIILYDSIKRGAEQEDFL